MQAEAAHLDRAQVIAALKQASVATGSDFHYLLGTALRESGLKTQAQSSTSSACGLFQFVGQTWLGLIKEHGAKYGLGAYANAISKDGEGHFRVANADAREAILALRKDAKVAALMAGEFSNRSRQALTSTLGREVCEGELYAAHFLGPAAACKLIRLRESQPDTRAADAFPQAADANRSVFYRADGTAKTVREVYDWALRQPNAAAAPAPESGQAPRLRASATAMPETDLMSALLSWSPQRPSFSAFDDDGDPSLPVAPFLLTPGVMDILSRVSPSFR